MDDLNILLNENDMLSRISLYELWRDDSRMFINVREFLSTTKKHKFIASPSYIVKEGKEEFIGRGDTKEEALKDCLSRIKGLSIESLFSEK